jgi:hypothetical protein
MATPDASVHVAHDGATVDAGPALDSSSADPDGGREDLDASVLPPDSGTSVDGGTSVGPDSGGASGSARDCDSARLVTVGSMIAIDDTCTLGADIEISPYCSAHDRTASPDAAYVFTPTESGFYDVAVEDLSDEGWLPILTVGLATEPCGTPFVDEEHKGYLWCGAGPGKGWGASVLADFEAGTTYFIVVDGWASLVTDASSCGRFALSITPTDPF